MVKSQFDVIYPCLDDITNESIEAIEVIANVYFETHHEILENPPSNVMINDNIESIEATEVIANEYFEMHHVILENPPSNAVINDPIEILNSQKILTNVLVSDNSGNSFGTNTVQIDIPSSQLAGSIKSVSPAILPSASSDVHENHSSNIIISTGNHPSSADQPDGSTQTDLEKLVSLKGKHFKNPCIAYLNINSLRGNKFIQLKEMLNSVKPEILCIDETKLTSDFTTANSISRGTIIHPFEEIEFKIQMPLTLGEGKLYILKRI